MGKKQTYYTRAPGSLLEYLVPVVFSKATLQKLPPAERKQFKPIPQPKPPKSK